MGRKKTRVSIVCSVCKTSFEVLKCREYTAKTCSRKCHSEFMKGHRPFNWNGGRLVHKGYVYILTKGHPNGDRDGYVPEHRLVMEKKIERYLTSIEVVHHINGDKSDNRLDNLELHESQSVHMKEHHPKGDPIYKGKHPFIGRNHSEETKRKLSEINKGKPRIGNPSKWKMSESTKLKLSLANKGRIPSQETRKKLSESQTGERNGFYGKNHSEETRRKMVEAWEARRIKFPRAST